MSLLEQLNEQQRQAAECIDGPVLIFAGAGSGKTRALTYRIAHMIRNCGVKPHQILAVTFTNKAAGEMKERIEALVGEAARDVWAGTFHSMCARMLRVDGAAMGIPPEYSIYDEADQQSLMKEILARLEPVADEAQKAADWTTREVLDAISQAKNELMDPDRYRRTRRGDFEKLVAQAYARYQRALERNQALDFDDLIMKAVELLETQPQVREKYQRRFRYILVDEYQDINHAQFRFVQLLAEAHGNLCVVGDDDQSIYGWRGANVGIILDFQEHFPDATVIKLEQNYRSTGKIIECAFELIRRNEGRADKRLWTANPPGDNLVVYQALNGEEEAEWVAETISTQVRAKLAQPGDYAVLYRTNAMSRAFEQALATLQIPYEIVGGLSFFERAEIKDAIAYLRALFNPADDLSVRRIINT
ncbi:MAG: UvrD-helicase domain-containing protein, partial [Armatimonadetes bacterium]|nr:UvrD-helicase domain-containing protein [Armatimonadota bacterium]